MVKSICQILLKLTFLFMCLAGISGSAQAGGAGQFACENPSNSCVDNCNDMYSCLDQCTGGSLLNVLGVMLK